MKENLADNHSFFYICALISPCIKHPSMKSLALHIPLRWKSYLLLNIAGLALIYFLPALSHLLSFPLYLIEPMRLMVVLALVHTNRPNAWFLAATLPVFSFLVSGHPFFLKSLLIAIELLSFVWFFSIFSKLRWNTFASMLTAILTSKLIYYGLKALLISLLLIRTELVSTPWLIQAAVTLAFSLYALMFFRNSAGRQI